MTTILDLVTKFTADVNDFKKDIHSAETTVSKLSTTLKNTAKVAAGVAVAGIVALSAAVVGSLATTINWAGKMEDAGRIMGTTASQTAGLAVIAKETGGDVEAMATQVAYLGKNLEDAKGGLGTSGQALATLGISARDANGDVRPTIEILQDVADKLGPMPDSLAKTNLQMDLFGKTGKGVGEQMERMANGGLSLAEEKAKSFGLVVGKDAADAVDKLETSLADVKLMGQGFAVSVGSQLMPIIQPLIEGFIKWGMEAMPKLIQGIKDAIPFITNLAKVVWNIVEPVAKVTGWIIKQAASVVEATVAYKEYMAWIAQARVTTAMLAITQAGLALATTEVTEATQNMTQAEVDQSYSLDEIARLYALSEEGAGNYTSALDMAYDSQMNMNQANLDSVDAANNAALAQQAENDRLFAAQDLANKAATAIGEDLASAYDDLKIAQQNWLLNVGGAAQNVLAGMPGLSENVRLAIQTTIDKLTGTTVVATNQMDADLLAAFTDYKTTLDEAKLEEDILAIAGKFETELAPGIQTALDKINELKQKLDVLSDRHIKTYIDIIYNDNPPGILRPSGATAEERLKKIPPPPPEEKASGGLISQPGVYSLAEHGPELVLNAEQTKAYLTGKSGDSGAIHNHYYNIAASYKTEDEKTLIQGIRQLQMLEG